MKLLRPLHRQRVKRRNKAVILSSNELVDTLGIPREDLEAYLSERGLPFHKDSQGEIWLSSFADASLTEEAE